MPYLKIRGIEKEIIVENSKELIDGVSKILGYERERFTIEYSDTKYLYDGEIREGYIFVEILWFERDLKIKQELANFITKFIKKYNNNRDCCVIFFPLQRKNFYKQK